MSDDKDNVTWNRNGRPMAVDSDVVSASSDVPAFITPPDGAPVYCGFPVLEDVVVDGFIFGKITDFDAEPCTEGDAFLIAPDNSRAGLVWEVGETVSISEAVPMDANRWGVWTVTFPHEMDCRENARRNLESILPPLRKKWEAWRQKVPAR